MCLISNSNSDEWRLIFGLWNTCHCSCKRVTSRHEQCNWGCHWHWLFGDIDIDYWHWIGDFGIIDIAIDIDLGQWFWVNIDIAIDIEGRKTLTLSLTLSVFYCQIIGIEHWKHQVTLANSASQWRVLEHWIWWTNFSNIIKGCMPSQIQMIEKCDMWTNAIIV